MSEERIKSEMVKIREQLKETGGAFDYDTKRIIIFADRTRRSDVEKRFFHENLHGIIDDFYGDNKRGIAERFYASAPQEIGGADKAFVEKKYPQERQAEEFFVRCLSQAMSEGNIQSVLDYLPEQEDVLEIDKILNTIGYDRKREEEERGRVGGENAPKDRPSSYRKGLSDNKRRIAKHIDKLVEKLGTKARTTV